MKLDYQQIEDKANELYGIAALKRVGKTEKDMAYIAPELFPKIASEQVKCFFRALVDEINHQQTK